MTKDPVVSVVLTTFNRADLLPRALDSVLKQTFTDFELIVVDDYSQDETAEVVEEFEDERIKYRRHPENRGLSAARNTGVRHASGEYIAFLDDDDEWLPTKLGKQVEYIQGLPDSVGMVYSWMDYYDGDKIVAERHPELRGSIFEHVLESQPLGNGSTWLVRRSAALTVGQFDENIRRGIDGDFVRRICQRYEVDFVSEVLVRVYVGHGHSRITRSDEQGIRNAIKGQEAKLTKFKKELDDYPKQTASILAAIAYHYSELDDWHSAVAYYWRAILTHPFSTRPYASFLRAFRRQVTKRRA